MKFYLVTFFLLISSTIFSQTENSKFTSHFQKQFFVSTSIGIQISGIKNEDFISKNVAPALTIGFGVWFKPEIAVQLSYKGPYFYTIADDDKHPYHSIFGELLLNVNKIVNSKKDNKNRWSLILHSGPGYFYNNYFNKASLNANLGLINNIKLTEQLSFFMDVSFIVGWDIYQGDEDILPSIVLGASYSFQ